MNKDYEKGFKDGRYQVYRKFEERVFKQPFSFPAIIKLTDRERNKMFNIIMNYEAHKEEVELVDDDVITGVIELDKHYFDYGLYEE